tara:strand:+ start:348 stop:671 length:324 start_codon:yes stop_codon:yes gene_type:complete
MATKYWLGNNPNAQVDDATLVALKSLSDADLDKVDAMVSELKTMTDAIPVAVEADAAAMTFAAGSIDTGTDMTAAEAGQIVTDLGELRTKVNNILAKLRTAKILDVP